MSSDPHPQHIHDPSPDLIESYYLETREGLFFAVKGLEQPPDRYIAVLRYAPDARNGTRRKDGMLYRRFYSFSEQEHLIKATFPHYFSFDPVFQVSLQSVPRSAVRRIFDPRRKFADLMRSPSLSRLEEDATDFLRLLQRESRVPSSALGVTGSLLIGLHTEESDIDVVAFGEDACRKVHQTLRRLLDSRSCEIQGLDPRGLKELYAQRAMDEQMQFEAFAALEKRKVNQGKFRNRTYFIRFVREANETGEAYGDSRYTNLARAVIKGTITDARDALFTPCRYPLAGVHILEGRPVTNLDSIVSYRGRFCEQAFSGETVLAAGTLERVDSHKAENRYRLLLGNFPEDAMNLFVS